MELGTTSRDSTGFGEMEEGLITSVGRNLSVPLPSDFNRRVPAELEQESQASSFIEEWNFACLSSCSGVVGGHSEALHPWQRS